MVALLLIDFLDEREPDPDLQDDDPAAPSPGFRGKLRSDTRGGWRLRWGDETTAARKSTRNKYSRPELWRRSERLREVRRLRARGAGGSQQPD
jgi:hypothetical protein